MKNLLVNYVSELEQTRIPIHWQCVEVEQQRTIVDPEHAIILRLFRNESQPLLQFLRPVDAIDIRIIALPTNVWPRVFQLQQFDTLRMILSR